LKGNAGTLTGRSRGLPGPSAVSGSRRQFWDLLIVTSVANFRNRYVDTVFGFIWMFAGPLIFFGVVYVFVTQIIERFNNIPNYGLLLLFNIVLFNLFRVGSGRGMRSLVRSGGLVRKMAVPRAVLPLSAVATALYVTLANMVVVIAWMLIDGIEPRWTWLLLPVLIVWMLAITCAIAFFLAGIFVRFRDIGQVWPAMVQVLFYASPVIWPFGVIRDEIIWDAQVFNPLAPVLAQARTWIFDPSSPGWFEVRTGFDAFLPFIILGVIALLAVVIFGREAKRAAEDL
jgi:ABC-2 type transport system permease protein